MSTRAKFDLALRRDLVGDPELSQRLPRSLPGDREVGILISDPLRRQERFLDRSGRRDIWPGPAFRHADSRENARNQSGAVGNDGPEAIAPGNGAMMIDTSSGWPLATVLLVSTPFP